jgi:tetratricopeptide (TPR) repeat protein
MAQSGSDYKSLIAEAERALINEEWQYALTLFEQLLPLAPDKAERAEVLNGRGVALLKLERYEEAIAMLEEAQKLEPDKAEVYFNRALICENIGDFEGALAFYNRTIELKPDDAEAYFRRGGIYFQSHQFEETVADNTRAIELHSGEAVTGPYIARGLAYHQLEQYPEALKDYSQALEIDPRGAADAYFYRALIHMDMEEALPARADLQAFLLMTDDLDGLLATQAHEIIEALDNEA